MCSIAKDSFCLVKKPFTASNLAYYNIGFGVAALIGGLIAIILRNRVKHSSSVLSNKNGNTVKAGYL